MRHRRQTVAVRPLDANDVMAGFGNGVDRACVAVLRVLHHDAVALHLDLRCAIAHLSTKSASDTVFEKCRKRLASVLVEENVVVAMLSCERTAGDGRLSEYHGKSSDERPIASV
jgi:hypothetical protein